MAKEKKRILKKDDEGLILYYGYTTIQYPYNYIPAKVIMIDKKNKIYIVKASFHYDFFIFLRFQDASDFFFFNEEEVRNAQDYIPKSGEIWYRIIGERVYERKIYGLKSDYSKDPSNYYYIKILFAKGESAPFEELGKTVFKTEAEARETLEKLKSN